MSHQHDETWTPGSRPHHLSIGLTNNKQFPAAQHVFNPSPRSFTNMPQSFAISIDIAGPRDAIFQKLVDLGNVQDFHPHIKKSYDTGTKRKTIGAERVCELKPFGKAFERLSNMEEGKSLTIAVDKIAKGPPIKGFEVVFGLEDVNGSNQPVTRVSVNGAYVPKGIARLLNGALRNKFA